MSDFSFTSTAQCDYCGNLLSESGQECDDCDESERGQQMFRKTVGDGRPIAIEAVPTYKWEKLESVVGDEWIEYEWIGPRSSVQTMLSMRAFDSAQDVPARQMAVAVTREIGE